MEVELGDLYLNKGSSLDPAKYPEETFEYYSIPAYDIGEPEIILGSEIGSSKKVFQPNDIILSRIVPHIRRCWVVGSDSGYRQIGSGEWITFRSENIEASYLRHYLMSNEFNAKFLKTIKGVGGSLMRADPKQVGRFKINLPPLDQQKKIAAILDAADAYRQKTKALIEKYDELTQSLFLDMFGDPMINPKGWESSKLGLLVENKDSKRIPVKSIDRDNMSSEFPYYGASGVIDYVDDYTHEGDNLLIGEDGANLLARSTPIAFIAKGQYWVNNHAHVLGYNGKSLLVFLEFYINLINLSPYISGSAQPKLNRKNMDQIEVYCPPLKLQNQFADRVQAIEEQKAQAEASLAQAEDLFNSLLQRAFKGELTKT